MWYKKLVNFYVFILSILIVNLISDFITGWLLGLRFLTNPVSATIIGMAVLVFMLYPAYHYAEKWSDGTARRIFKIGKNAGGKFTGVTLAFFVCLLLLFMIYLVTWFGMDALITWATATFRALEHTFSR